MTNSTNSTKAIETIREEVLHLVVSYAYNIPGMRIGKDECVDGIMKLIRSELSRAREEERLKVIGEVLSMLQPGEGDYFQITATQRYSLLSKLKGEKE